ncbi:expressed unknown protein [Seminavis robusta]|uniref:DUF6824 domain-containing protein n=1 Tax=Seminavis robusta TaxID=568900 RepID=A0A9N8DQM1_9STRA|nr:expressed unknown protein [Seminavis robusta]|eukprot:Sro217_g089600.1 n/a (196) ;mRNA; r:6203-6790
MSEQGLTIPFRGYDYSFYWHMYSPPQTPRPDDVILGRGGKKHEHTGNERLQKMALEMVCEYMKARKKEKGKLAEELVQRVHQNGGRFMEQKLDNGPWEVVSFDKARAKARDCLHSILADPKKLLRDRLRTFSVGDGNPFAGLEEDDAAGTWTHMDEGMGGDTTNTTGDNNVVMDSHGLHDMEFPVLDEDMDDLDL